MNVQNTPLLLNALSVVGELVAVGELEFPEVWLDGAAVDGGELVAVGDPVGVLVGVPVGVCVAHGSVTTSSLISLPTVPWASVN